MSNNLGVHHLRILQSLQGSELLLLGQTDVRLGVPDFLLQRCKPFFHGLLTRTLQPSQAKLLFHLRLEHLLPPSVGRVQLLHLLRLPPPLEDQGHLPLLLPCDLRRRLALLEFPLPRDLPAQLRDLALVVVPLPQILLSARRVLLHATAVQFLVTPLLALLLDTLRGDPVLLHLSLDLLLPRCDQVCPSLQRRETLPLLTPQLLQPLQICSGGTSLAHSPSFQLPVQIGKRGGGHHGGRSRASLEVVRELRIVNFGRVGILSPPTSSACHLMLLVEGWMQNGLGFAVIELHALSNRARQRSNTNGQQLIPLKTA
mmetsp:Transcript_37584/g.99900  ORF Transcript_37584/g.99900 Transcript_37584/m.99900 type:complete len:314 (+) Transcript_37584:679-1620(+)